MTSQLNYCYSVNRLSPKPFSKVLMTGYGGKLQERLEGPLGGQSRKWARFQWRTEDVEQVFTTESDAGADKEAGTANPFANQTFVYLTADSTETLETLKEDETYIIGGIVDKNRYKVLKLVPCCRIDRKNTDERCAGRIYAWRKRNGWE